MPRPSSHTLVPPFGLSLHNATSFRDGIGDDYSPAILQGVLTTHNSRTRRPRIALYEIRGRLDCHDAGKEARSRRVIRSKMRSGHLGFFDRISNLIDHDEPQLEVGETPVEGFEGGAPLQHPCGKARVLHGTPRGGALPGFWALYL